MAGIVLENCCLVDIDPASVRFEKLRIADGLIAGIGAEVQAEPGDEVVDCSGAVILPGLVNGHTHLYSALAVGMPPPSEPPENFLQILERVWWKLDVALDIKSIETSATIGAIEALRCGTTTLIDHHASPNSIDGSLDAIERCLDSVGLRGVLCYETTDRHGLSGREAGLAENDRYLARHTDRHDGRFAGLVGAHALFTLEDETLSELSDLAKRHDVGVHIHVAEDPCDEEVCTTDHQIFLSDRLRSHGLLRPETIIAHGTHLANDDVATIASASCSIAHNTRSNMNNGVGYAPLPQLASVLTVLLGTDGIGGDMFAEARTAWFKMCDEQTALSPDSVLKMLANSARRASQSLGVELGKLKTGCVADIVLTDYLPAGPIHAGNVAGHLLFGLEARHVRDVIIGGQWRLRDRKVLGVDEGRVRREASEVSASLWERM